MRDLELADEALATSDHARAIAALVRAWRIYRTPAIADAVEQLAKLAPGPLEAKLAKRIPNRVKPAIAFVKRLLAEDDPRVASYYHAVFLARPIGGPEFELEMFDLIIRARDPRSIELLSNLQSRLHWRAMIYNPEEFEASRVRARQKLIAAQADLPALGPAATAALVSIQRRVTELLTATSNAGLRGAELLAAIRAEPADDRPRAIYADWLLERGDPYGEFIALQLAGRATKREQALLRKHGAAWLGRLGAVADVKQCRFARGFVVAFVAHRDASKRDLEAVAGVDEWWSVEELDRDSVHLPDPAMRSLHTIGRVGMAVAHRLATTDPPLALTSLGVWLDPPTFPRTRPGLPRLQHLALHQFGPPLAAPLLELLKAPIARGLRSVAIEIPTTRFTLTADGDGHLTQLVIASPRSELYLNDEVLALARATPISRIELVVPHAYREHTEQLLRSMLERVPSVPPLVVTVLG